MSRFAGSLCTVDIPIIQCLTMIPKELVMEIFSYLEMGIILDFGSCNKNIILNCIKDAFRTHRIPAYAFDMIYRECNTSMIIQHVLELSPRLKNLIMRKYVDRKIHDRKSLERQTRESQMQDEMFANIKKGDFVFHKKTHSSGLVMQKSKSSVKVIFIQHKQLNGNSDITIVIPPRLCYYRILKSSLFIYDTIEEPLKQFCETRFTLHCMAVGFDSFDVYNKIYDDHVGHFPRSRLVDEIMDYYLRLQAEM